MSDPLWSAEEAQAATEEGETLNEELQATNEELETLNEELQATVEELNTTNDDLQSRSIELQETAISAEIARARLEAVLSSMGMDMRPSLARRPGSRTGTTIEIPSPSEIAWLKRRVPVTCRDSGAKPGGPPKQLPGGARTRRDAGRLRADKRWRPGDSCGLHRG